MTDTHKPLSPEHSSLSLAEQKLEKERLLVGLIKKFNVPFRVERSCKISEKKLLINRFIFYVKKNSLGKNASGKILDICFRLGMPGFLFDSFQKILPDLSYVHFGFEEGEKTCSYKIYGEFEVDKKSIPKLKEPFLGALGFKWDAFNPAKNVVTKYTCFPALSLESIQKRIADIFQSKSYPLLLEASKDILGGALESITLDDIIYLEVADGDGPCRSFDLNVYYAGLQMQNIRQATTKILKYFSIPAEIYENIYGQADAVRFGHLSGGTDKEGKAFVTLYGGMAKHESESSSDSAGRKKASDLSFDQISLADACAPQDSFVRMVASAQEPKINGFSSLKSMDEAHSPVISFTVEALQGAEQYRVVDLGCGNGALLHKIIQRKGNVIPYGLDISAAAINAAKLLDPENAENYHVGSMLDPEVLESLGDRFSLALLMPGRLLEAESQNRDALLRFLRLSCDKIVVYAYSDWCRRFGNLRQLVKKAGLEINGVVRGGENAQAATACLMRT